MIRRPPGRGAARFASAVVLAVGAVIVAAGPVAAADEAAVRRCVIENLPRYDSPNRAAVAQYADLEASCRAAIDGEERAQVQIVPVEPGGDSPAAAGDRAGDPLAAETPADDRTSGRDPAEVRGPGAPEAPAARDAPTSVPTPGRPGARGTSAAEEDSAAALVQVAEDGQAPGAVLPDGGGGVSGWLLALLGGAAALVAGAAGVGALRRRR